MAVGVARRWRVDLPPPVKPALAPSTPTTTPHCRCRRLLPARQTTTPPHRRWLPVLPPPGRLRLHLIVVGCLCCSPAASQADYDSTSSSLATCAAAWLPIIKRHTPCRFDRSLLFSQITFGDEMCEDPRASYEAPSILHKLISGPGAAASNSARTKRRTAQ